MIFYYRFAIVLLLFFNSCAITSQKTHDHKITEKYWKLLSLNGNSILSDENQQSEAHFILKEEENKMSGNTGCNTMGGSYELLENNRIKFSRIFSTKMYCVGVDYEQEFMNSLQNTTSFEIKNDTLFLLNSANDTVAKMKAD